MNKRARKITFPSVGIEQGSRVWRNSETGVEIIKGKNFKEVGLYYVCVPVRAGRRMVDYRITPHPSLSLASSTTRKRSTRTRRAIGNRPLGAWIEPPRSDSNHGSCRVDCKSAAEESAAQQLHRGMGAGRRAATLSFPRARGVARPAGPPFQQRSVIQTLTSGAPPAPMCNN